MKPFKFKKFTVQQDKTAMKIGTDAILLGAWASLQNNPDCILDIGSGTGIIALMLAQRSEAQTIDALEIEENAYAQSVENFENSPWGDRLFCYHTSFQKFAKEMAKDNEKYDTIISNPPFYTDSYKTEDEARNKARFTTTLSFDELIKGTAKLLSKKGVFYVIVPFKEEQNFIEIATKYCLFLNKICHIKGNPKSDTKRSLLAFSFTPLKLQKTSLLIEKERHKYTQEYINLTKDFYLKM